MLLRPLFDLFFPQTSQTLNLIRKGRPSLLFSTAAINEVLFLEPRPRFRASPSPVCIINLNLLSQRLIFITLEHNLGQLVVKSLPLCLQTLQAASPIPVEKFHSSLESSDVLPKTTWLREAWLSEKLFLLL